MPGALRTSLAVALALASVGACSGSKGLPVSATPACPLLAQLAETGKAVAHADVGDPEHFDATLKTAVTDYVRIARRLQAVVPIRLRSDVARLEAAAQQYRFADATKSRAAIDEYARSQCAGNAKSGS